MQLMVASLRRMAGVCAAMALCMSADAHALPLLRSVRIDGNNQEALTVRQPSAERLEVAQQEEVDMMTADGNEVEDEEGEDDEDAEDVAYSDEDYEMMYGDEVMSDGTSFRKLLHGCHGAKRCRKNLTGCPRCRFPSRSGNLGHCRRRGKLHNCRRNRMIDGTAGNEGNEGRAVSPFLAADGFGSIGPGECPSIHALALPGHLGLSPDFDDYADGDYEVERVELDYVVDAFGYNDDIVQFVAPEFATVSTRGELRRRLRQGVSHIVVTQHLDLINAQTEPDLPKEFEALNNAVGRVKNTTLSIVGRCEGPPPGNFNLTEPMPPGACALRVREDFLDAPSGTTCLLIDSLYVLVAPRGEVMTSSVLILHIDGLMWINNCVFQGAGLNGRAIDTNTGNGRVDGRRGRPSLYIKDTTFTGFVRSLGPGIRARRGSRLWLDNCVFRDITLTPAVNRLEIQASGIAAESNVELIIVNTTFVDNVVYGEPAGDRAVAISPNRTEILASPRMRVWLWPDGPFVMTDPNVGIAESIITGVARPILESILDITQEVTRRGLSQLERNRGAN